MTSSGAMDEGVGVITHRVDYSETDQMSVVYHARYLVWLEIGRTEYLRSAGMSYASMEQQGYRLVVGTVSIRYRRPARYDDVVRVRTWVREVASRRVDFGYAIDRPSDEALLVTATTMLVALNDAFVPARLPADVARMLKPVPDVVTI